MKKVSSILAVSGLVFLMGCNDSSVGPKDQSSNESSGESSSALDGSSENGQSSLEVDVSSSAPDTGESESSSVELISSSDAFENTNAESSSSTEISSEDVSEEPSSAEVSSSEEAKQTYAPQVWDEYDLDYLFDNSELRSFHFVIPEGNLSALDSDPMAEEYYAGKLVFEGDTLDNIGIRYKGSLGSFWGCIDNNGELGRPDPDLGGTKACIKLSMKIKINYGDENGDRRFCDVKKLQFHSMNGQPSQIRERLAYWFFEEMGVPISKTVNAKVYINGTLVGLFLLVEQVDGSFVKERFDDNSGSLFKEIWPIDEDGVPYGDIQYIERLKANEEAQDINNIRAFGDDLSQAAEGEEGAVMSDWMDRSAVMDYIAVDRAIDNDDGVFMWWLQDSINEVQPHNFFWYDDVVNSKMVLIPWDVDGALRGPAGHFPDPFEENYTCELVNEARNAQCDKLARAMLSYPDEYKASLQKVLNGPVAQARGKIALWREQVKETVKELEELYPGESGVPSFYEYDSAVETLLQRIDAIESKLQQELAQ